MNEPKKVHPVFPGKVFLGEEGAPHGNAGLRSWNEPGVDHVEGHRNRLRHRGPYLACCIFIALIASATFAADPPPPGAQNALATARRQRDQKKWEESIKTCEQVLAMQAAWPTQKIEACEIEIDVQRRQKNLEAALATALRLEKELPQSPEALTRSSILQGELNQELNKKALALAAYTTAIQQTNDPRTKQYCNYRIGSIHLSEGRADDAIAAFDHVFTDSSGSMDYWSESQHGIVDALQKANRFPEALAAAKICLNTATDANSIAANSQLIATLFQNLDKNVTRANAFLAYQQYGPSGKNGSPLTNPLDAIAYPTYPQREKTFAQLRDTAGDDAAASRIRAWTYVYTGHPTETLAHFAEYFRRSYNEPYPMLGVINDLVVVGVRGVRGHAVNLEKCIDFIRLGPDGPDGKTGTPDDLQDPFADIGLKPHPPSPNGGLAPPSPAALKALIEMRAMLETLAVAEREDSYFRREIISYLDRVHMALCDWGAPGQADWYLKLLRDATANEYDYSTVLRSAQTSARGSDLHYGNVRNLWQKLDANDPSPTLRNAGQVKAVRDSFNSLMQLLEKPQPLAPSLPPLK